MFFFGPRSCNLCSRCYLQNHAPRTVLIAIPPLQMARVPPLQPSMRCNRILFYFQVCQCHKTILFALLHLLFIGPIQATVFTHRIFYLMLEMWTYYSGILLTQTCIFSFDLVLGCHQCIKFLKWRKQCLSGEPLNVKRLIQTALHSGTDCLQKSLGKATYTG